MDEDSPKIYGRVSKKCSAHISPDKLTLSGNFSDRYRAFDIHKASMRKDILNTVIKKTESQLRSDDDDNPMYEDPRDVVGEKPPKPPRKRTIHGVAITSPGKDNKSVLKEQKRKLTKKYEALITSLMDKYEENVLLLSEKDVQISKLKDKLKSVLDYNKLFAEENDQLRSQHDTLVKYVEECKKVIREERERNDKLEERVKKFEVPDREQVESTAIPLVEVCMSCSSRQIVLNQAREHNSRLQKDMQALKDVLYRLNVQLSRYQEKLRTNIRSQNADGKADNIHTPVDRPDGLDSLLTVSLGYRDKEGATSEDGVTNKSGVDDPTHATRVVDLSGLLSAQALAPLFDAYQENLQEKDNLILDYEKQFEVMNKKSKLIVSENKSLQEKVSALEEQLGQARQGYKKAVVEKETTDIEKATLVERAERAESKLKEVYELYEGKMSALMRDYETVHREYFLVRSALEAAQGKVARTVPADLHERRLDHCKRLLEELKHQYGMESERRKEQMTKLEEQLRAADEQAGKAALETQKLKDELDTALKNVRLYRRAAVIFRQRLRAASSRMMRARTSASRRQHEPLKHALHALDKIKHEIKAVKSRAYTSLEELERRILHQERRAALAQAEHRRELERAALALEHKEGIIRSLIDKVADVEEVRLSQTNTHRLQGIVSDSSPDRSPDRQAEKKGTQTKPPVKLVPGSGGYFQYKDLTNRRKGKG